MSLKGYKEQLGYIKQDVKDLEKYTGKGEYEEIPYIINNIKDEIECIEDEMDEVESQIDDMKCNIEKLEG